MSILVPEIFLVDGENLVTRFQAMTAAGRVPRGGVAHRRDEFVWSSQIIQPDFVGNIRRVSYYTSAVGDDAYIAGLEKCIRDVEYTFRDHAIKRSRHLHPRVYKKPSKSTKSRSVDINIVIDSLRYARGESVGVVRLMSGDGDFAPLVRELVHAGLEVHVMALSSGLSAELQACADEFTLLDDDVFEPAV